MVIVSVCSAFLFIPCVRWLLSWWTVFDLRQDNTKSVFRGLIWEWIPHIKNFPKESHTQNSCLFSQMFVLVPDSAARCHCNAAAAEEGGAPRVMEHPHWSLDSGGPTPRADWPGVLGARGMAVGWEAELPDSSFTSQKGRDAVAVKGRRLSPALALISDVMIVD